ncbi:MAG: hypothetical protein ABI304_04545, partial [Rudaea sp.]
NEVSPNTPEVFALHDAAAVPASIRVDQPGIDGAWYAPYESGQGFTLDYIASANVLFMPWFTYAPNTPFSVFAPSYLNDPARLAWYTFQGNPVLGATGVDLTIAITDPGTFDAGTVAARQVGSAHLSFIDCSSALLDYQFDADVNQGQHGLISLSRLTPSTSPCVLANGQTSPAQIGNTPAQGFDARQSGSWYDPATSGQGMEISIIPRSNDFNGFVFIAWFTYDPANRGDDPAQQHWFTLSNDLSTATNGSVTLPILRTIGGALDEKATGNTVQIGHAVLTMRGCDRATLQYQFDQTAITHSFVGLSGSIDLKKIGGCTIP